MPLVSGNKNVFFGFLQVIFYVGCYFVFTDLLTVGIGLILLHLAITMIGPRAFNEFSPIVELAAVFLMPLNMVLVFYVSNTVFPYRGGMLLPLLVAALLLNFIFQQYALLKGGKPWPLSRLYIILFVSLITGCAIIQYLHKIDIILISFALSEWFLILFILLLFVRSVLWLKKLKLINFGIWLFLVAFFLIVTFGPMVLSEFQFLCILGIYGSWYALKLAQARIIDGVEKSTGLFTPLIMVVSHFMDSLGGYYMFYIVLVYLVTNVLLLYIRSYRIIKATLNQ